MKRGWLTQVDDNGVVSPSVLGAIVVALGDDAGPTR